MQQINNYWTQPWHHVTLVFQRGKVVAAGKNEFAVRSANGTIKVWHVNGETKTKNVGGTATGMSAMTGGSNMQVPSWWTMDTRTTRIAQGRPRFRLRRARGPHAQGAASAVRGTDHDPTRMPMATLTAAPTVTAPAPAPTGVGATVTGTHF